MTLSARDLGRRIRACRSRTGFQTAWSAVSALVVLLLTAHATLASGASSEVRQNFTKYSPLTQITAANVKKLEKAWEYHTGEAGNPSGAFFAFEDEPLPVDGNLIVCTVSRRLIALDPATGKERWTYDPGGKRPGMLKCRGITAWTDAEAAEGQACRTRLFLGTVDYRLVAVDAKTGHPCEDFGAHGVVKMQPSLPEIFPGEYTTTSRPAVVNGVVVVGSTVSDNERLHAPSGRVLAFDARTGAPRWQFDPIPRDPSDPAAKTWLNGNANEYGGGNVWSMMAVDEKHDLIYLPTTAPSVDFFGGGRPGDNLYANSLVALRGATGEMVWHFQFVHHDIWDYDLPTPPILIDYPHDGEMVPALVQNTKQGLIFIFNRVTGEPLVPIEERPVPQKGTVPGEAPLSPTQPFPVGMPALSKLGFSEDDLWGFTPFDKGSCRQKIKGMQYGPIYTPPSEQGTVFLPGPAGGANWGGAAYDPDSHIMVVPNSRIAHIVKLIPQDQIEVKEHQKVESITAMTFPNRGAPYVVSFEPLMSSFGAPCVKPPWGALTAVDLVQKKIVWDVPLGSIEKLAPVPIPLELGTPGAGGPLATAGGVVFIGFSLDDRFRAFDLKSGKVLWKSKALPAPAVGTPVTYEAGGEQYVVIAAGGHSVYGTETSDAVIAYKLGR